MRRVLVVLLVVVLLAGAGALGYLAWNRARIEQFSRTPFGVAGVKVVDIAPKTGPRRLADALAQAGIVKSADDFYSFERRENAGPHLKAGEYEFDGAVTPVQVLQKIVSGEVKLHHFTVPEGLRVEEILPIIAASDLKLDLHKLEALADSKSFVRKLGVPADTLEGFLFPDTYSFTKGATEEAVLTKMVARTLEEYKKADADRKPGIKLNLLQTITLASIVEKETGTPEERPHISCVFHNRLKKDMKLETDPTVLYAMRLINGKFTKNITVADLRRVHPYNTYTVKGLPPGPIASPGTAALRAALHPMACNDLFFVSRNDGTSVFCPDLKCHDAAVKKWQIDFFKKKPRG